MGSILLKAFSYIFVIILGYVLKKTRFLPADAYQLIMKITLNLTMPAAVITNFSSFSFSNSLLYITLLSLGINLFMWGVGYLLSIKKDGRVRALYTMNCPGYNIGAFTMPYVQGFLGAAGVVSTCLFDAGNAIMCTGGSYALASAVCGGENRPTLKECLKRLLTTPFCMYVLMLTLSILSLKLPAGLVSFLSPIANANVFMSMFMVGTMFEFKPDKSFLLQAATVICARYVLAAGFAALFFFVLPFPLEIRQVLAIICFAPCSAMSPAFTDKLGGNSELSSFIGSVTILLSVIIMTSLIAAMGLQPV